MEKHILTCNELQEAKKAYEKEQIFERMDWLANSINDPEVVDCIYHCIQLHNETTQYETIAAIVKKLEVNKVIDIGACTGVQEMYFHALGIDYKGIEIMDRMEVYSKNVQYKTAYPCSLENEEKSLLISNLCVGYLIDWLDCLPFISKDFDACLMNVPKFTPEEKQLTEKDFDISEFVSETDGQHYIYLQKRGN